MKRLFTVLAASALLATACGGSQGSGDTSGTIKIYQDIPVQSTTFSAPFMKSSAEAAVAEINDAGGINGRKLELVTCNNGYDPNLDLKCVQSAASNKSTVAMVGSLSSFGPQINPVLQAGKLPNIGPDALSQDDATSPMNFLMDTGVPGFAAMPAVAKKFLNATKIAVVNADAPSAAADNQFFAVGAKTAGVDIVKTISVPLDAADLTQYVSQVKGSGAQAIVSSMVQTPNLALWKAISSSGGGLHTVMSDGGVTQSLLQQAGPSLVEGNYSINGIPAPTGSNPTGVAYVAAMKKYQPNENQLTGTGMRAWAAVHLFADVVKTINGPITRDSVLSAFNKVHNMKFMWIDSLSFDKPGPLPNYPRIVTPITFPSVLTDAKYTAVDPFNPFQAG